jgi:hypothetical protein
MRLGQANYCDDCGAEIPLGASKCTECDPAGGAEQISFTFIVTISEDADQATVEEQPQPRRKFLWLF